MVLEEALLLDLKTRTATGLLYGDAASRLECTLRRLNVQITQLGSYGFLVSEATPLSVRQRHTGKEIPLPIAADHKLNLHDLAAGIAQVLKPPVAFAHPQTLTAPGSVDMGDWSDRLARIADQNLELNPPGDLTYPFFVVPDSGERLRAGWFSWSDVPFHGEYLWADRLPSATREAFRRLAGKAHCFFSDHGRSTGLVYYRSEQGLSYLLLQEGAERVRLYRLPRDVGPIHEDYGRLVDLPEDRAITESEFWTESLNLNDLSARWPRALDSIPVAARYTLPRVRIPLSDDDGRLIATALYEAKAEGVKFPRARYLPWEPLLPFLHTVIGTQQRVLDLLNAYEVIDKKQKSWWRDRLRAALIGRTRTGDQRQASEQGTVYFAAEEGRDKPVKIGWTDGDVSARLRQLQTGNPRPLEPIAEIPGSRELEIGIHRFLQSRQMPGGSEWFDITRAQAMKLGGLLGVARADARAAVAPSSISVLGQNLQHKERGEASILIAEDAPDSSDRRRGSR